jgi:hypothetical protein
MKALVIAAAFAVAAASGAHAQTGAPGATPSMPKKQTAAPKKPPRPAQFATGQKPNVVRKKYKCYSNCSVFETLCTDVGGTVSHTSDGGTVCTTKD